MKGIQIGNEKVELSLFTNVMTIYLESPRDSSRKLLDLINEFSKVSGYKINVHKSIVLLSANNDQDANQIKNSTPFTKSATTTTIIRNILNQGGERSLQGELQNTDERNRR